MLHVSYLAFGNLAIILPSEVIRGRSNSVPSNMGQGTLVTIQAVNTFFVQSMCRKLPMKVDFFPLALYPSCSQRYGLKAISIGALLNQRAIYHGSTATLAISVRVSRYAFPLLAMSFFINVSLLRRKVPIDSSNEDGEKAALTLIKFSAKSETIKEQYCLILEVLAVVESH
ncbi:uncharacterized protein BT62DRAFT_1076587 [Guyanagaster necrorhizus]|uniref:Uncharacterized protein n=1 Tax=Guyanagaster necrorhizus TaxID=856835 RepID=A0A9P7VRC7_9AGAR|nr:uncharacterized protein BT62DRAFT_1076587 [Guyanagaster necrorhizus MCA 3950]KAG7445494.1 hypothetical protein BT62DRAFT_1076587 [Guyanagaster necrorhizus MCA 3950]